MTTQSTTATPRLPHESNVPFLIDGGCETTLIFHEGLELPHFAAFVLLETEEGKEAIRRYYKPYLQVAKDHAMGFVLETPTWRASADWGKLLGYDKDRLTAVNVSAINLMQELRDEVSPRETPVIISGCVGPRGDGYVTGEEMSASEAESYHRPQIEALKSAGAEMATALTMTYAAEAIGITRAAQKAQLPVVISFTTETNGKLPNDQMLGDAIQETDQATDSTPIYYMINCAHPDHFSNALKGEWIERIGGFRANASRMSHAELDEAEELDAGDPKEFGELHGELCRMLPNVQVIGGCCGTDHRHVSAVAHAMS
ncbi:MAG: homocysteine S-methyltransferase family protein [Gammaproteobacteria bacterium]|nr:homocysteine S-methyltransferase family protein [Gammaproteobacteria bacterium]